jgi:hypothetical protein
MNTSQSS